MEIILEFLFEIVLEVVFEVGIQALVEVGWRSTRDVLGAEEPSWLRRVVSFVLAGAIAVALGWWRGTTVGGLGFGWWSTLAVAVAATIAAAIRLARPPGPRPAAWAILRWWPAARCAFFAVTNACFVVSYAVAANIAQHSPPPLR